MSDVAAQDDVRLPYLEAPGAAEARGTDPGNVGEPAVYLRRGRRDRDLAKGVPTGRTTPHTGSVQPLVLGVVLEGGGRACG